MCCLEVREKMKRYKIVYLDLLIYLILIILRVDLREKVFVFRYLKLGWWWVFF